MSFKYLLILAIVLAGLGYWMMKPRPRPDITEAQAKEIAARAFDDIVFNENLRGSAFHVKPSQGPPANPAYRWVFHWINDKDEPRQQVNILVDKTGVTGFELLPLPPLTEEEAFAAAAAASAAPEAVPAGAHGGAPPAAAP